MPAREHSVQLPAPGQLNDSPLDPGFVQSSVALRSFAAIASLAAPDCTPYAGGVNGICGDYRPDAVGHALPFANRVNSADRDCLL